MNDVMSNAKRASGGAAILIGAGLLALAGYDCGKRKGSDEIARLSTQIAQNEKTIEIKDGLYATKIVEMKGLQNLLDGSRKEVGELKKQLSDSQAQLLTTQEVVVKWKNAYEGALAAKQSDGGKSPPPPPDGTTGATPTVQRKRVDFAGDLGPIHADGHTLTDPPEAYLSLNQIRPLILTVSVAKNRDGTWQSYVTSSEPNMDVSVNLAGVDTGITSPTWKQRIWANMGVDFLWGQRASAGLSYHFDRWSLGMNCSTWGGSTGCGVDVGIRLFK